MTKYHGRNDMLKKEKGKNGTDKKKKSFRNHQISATLTMSSMSFLCVTAKAAKTTNGPHTDDSRRLFLLKVL